MTIQRILRAIFHGKPVAAEPSVDLARVSTSVDELSAFIGHYDGFIREAGLRRAAELASPQLLPAVAGRLNDWVPQVRAVAQKVLLGMLPSIGKDKALHLLPAVQRLRLAGRADHSAWIASFERALVEKIGSQAIIEGLLDPDVHVARACFRMVEAQKLAAPEAVIARLLPATRDIVLARHAVEAIFRLPEPERGPLLRRALQSSFGRVRAIALRPVLAEGSVENDALAIRMAADPQSWVRLIASGYLDRRGIDTAAILANTLRADDTSSTTMRACLAGLAELGRADQLDLVRSFTRHPLARVQLAAYAAWFHLAPSHKDEIARTVLASPHRRVRKLAMQLVREREAFLDVATALPLIAAHDDVDMMLTFARREAWIWLELIVQLEPRSHRDPELRIRLMRDLIAWIDDASKMYTKPSAAQRALFERDEVRQALAALLSRQDPVWTRNLAFQLEQSA